MEILSPFRSEGEASVNSLNVAIREEINPAAPQTPEIVYAGKIFRLNDRVMQMRNNYDIKLYDRSGKQVGEGVFNGDIGTIRKISGTDVVIEFDGRYMDCPQVLLDDLELSYAITIHKSMGSEYDTVIIPLLAAHNVLLTRNLLYTAITRAKRRVLLVGEKRALYMAIHRSRKGKRNTMLGERITLYLFCGSVEVAYQHDSAPSSLCRHISPPRISSQSKRTINKTSVQAISKSESNRASAHAFFFDALSYNTEN